MINQYRQRQIDTLNAIGRPTYPSNINLGQPTANESAEGDLLGNIIQVGARVIFGL